MMKKRVRIKDVAERAEVSTGTVDRVIHNRGRVAADVKKRVLEVMEELGFQRNLIASALAKNKNYKVAVLLPDYREDPYWEQPFAGIEKARKTVQHYGVNVEYHFFELLNATDFGTKAKEMLLTEPEGVLFPPIFRQEGEWLLKECEAREIPCVIINTNIQGVNKLSYIGQDSYQSGILGARLLNFGIAPNGTVVILELSKGAPNAKHLVEKKEGFKNYFANNKGNKIKILSMEIEDFNNKEKLKAILLKLINEHPNLAGIFFTNSRAYKAIECMDSALTQSVKIIGFDLIEQNLNFLFQDKINFLINQNPIEQGFLALQTLYKHLVLNEEVEPVQYLPLDIVVKENVQYYQKRGYEMVVNSNSTT